MAISATQNPSLRTRMKFDRHSTRDWTDLPILPSIADRLALIELLRFRAVCKAWYAASSAASDNIEALPDREPWFLLYGDDNSTCTLVTEYSNEKHTIDIPELNGTTCLASSHGWLLLFREGSVFFLCPLSRARIDIPVTFPHSVISNHVAVFSAPPTSKDCVVGVLSQTETEIELNVIRRGATSWTKHKLQPTAPRKICYAANAYDEAGFYFIEDETSMVYFSTEESKLYLARLVSSNSEEGLIFSTKDEENEMKGRLALDDMSQVSVCGTSISCDNALTIKLVPYENNRVSRKQGAWFQPRFHQITEKQSW
ncbi:hypothetical protein V6N13_004674 [Hibiscus sabdariffa]|uniref:KIB1-4 beta-propeller domain-containing protein n=1 Tax=Hibiscus sabdariffa TaxID=183260 RepID=A0ABR2RZH3_9ROSI